MFLGCRSTQAEYFDLHGRAAAETAASFSDLDRLNRFFRFALPFQEVLPRLLGSDQCARLEILDVGAGTGLLGRTLSRWAVERGWHWDFTNLDANPLSFGVANGQRTVVGSALDLPFPDASYDVVVASQMTHHLTDDEVVRHLREAWRVARHGVVISDLHRNAGLYAMLWLATRFMNVSRPVREDAVVSVRRGFRLDELRRLAQGAGLAPAKVWLFYGTRVVLEARK